MILLTTLLTFVACHGGAQKDSERADTTDSDAPIDSDGDGCPAGLDCDDADPARFPWAVERCDGKDNDCNGVVDDDAVDGQLGYDDDDGDGYGDPLSAERRCEPSEAVVQNGEDCDDANPAANPSQAELCLDDGVDEDCDGLIDGEDPDVAGVKMYYDGDGDGFGDWPAELRCGPSEGWSLERGDCDDSRAETYPGAKEACDDDRDHDCDYLYGCEDGDCATDSACDEQCNNGEDDDFDGYFDCEDDDCWSTCDPRIQSNINGGWANFKGMWYNNGASVSSSSQGVAYSVTGSVQFTSGTEQVSCDWLVPRVAYKEERGSTISTYISFSGQTGPYTVEFSSACPRTDLPVLPPNVGPTRGKHEDHYPRRAWIIGKVVVFSESCYETYFGVGCEFSGTIPVLSPTSARWGTCMLTDALTGTPCVP